MLTPSERVAGRAWRGTQQAALAALNAAQTPDENRPPFVRHIRHLCSGNQHRSVSFDYAEVYILSPEMVVYSADGNPVGVALVDDGAGQSWAVPQEHTKDVIPAGRFAFIYHEGRCADCSRTARSRALEGRVVDAWTRHPTGKVASRVG